MRSFLRIAFVFAPVFLDAQPAFPQGVVDTLYRERVEYEDGKISVDFDQTPLGVALNAIQIKTGLQITVPPATESKILNLRLSRLPLEPAVRSLIASIGFRNFALVYDEEGYPKRAVVLETRPEVRATPRRGFESRLQRGARHRATEGTGTSSAPEGTRALG